MLRLRLAARLARFPADAQTLVIQNLQERRRAMRISGIAIALAIGAVAAPAALTLPYSLNPN
jgi:hypothetical protein